jgi:CheY-like chemotaxis protein
MGKSEFERPAKKAVSSPEVAAYFDPAGNRRRVLVVTLREELWTQVARAFAAWRFSVHFSFDPRLVVEYADTFCPDVVLLDLDRSPNERLAIVDALRLSPRTRHIPVLATTQIFNRLRRLVRRGLGDGGELNRWRRRQKRLAIC